MPPAPLPAGPTRGSAVPAIGSWRLTSALRSAATHPVGPPALAAVLAVAAQLLGLHGTDQAMQTFMVEQVRAHGLSVVDPAWYGGVYPMAYSAAFPLIGAVLGLAGSAVAASVLAAWAFDRLTTAHFGRRSAGSWYFAASTLVQVGIGELPFLTGEALGLTAVLALARGRRGLALALGALAALCSPLAAAFLALACLAWWAQPLAAGAPRGAAMWATHAAGVVGRASRSGMRVVARRSWPLALAAATATVVLGLAVAFPGTGPFPFTWTQLVVVELLCLAVASPLVRAAPVVRLAVVLYGAASLLSFVVPNPLGGNAGRLGSAVGVPLLACFLSARARVTPRWRTYGAAVLVPFALWQWAPGLSALRPAHDAPSSTAAFYAPLLHRLAAAPPARSRIEVVPLADHWESVYVSRSGLSLARGWERQIDTGRNPIFYTPGALNAASYRAWLLANGISWVALPRVPTTEVDYAGTAEVALLDSGHVGGLTRVWESRDWVLWRVDGSPGLVSGPASLTSAGADRVVLDARSAGAVVVRVRASSYWALSPATAGCVGATADGWTSLVLRRPGTVALHAVVGPGRGPVCPLPPSP